MKVETMLAAKGDKVVTLRPDATVATVIRMLKLESIGALVVSEDGEKILGIISERDVVRALVDHGGEVLKVRVAELMTRSVKTCTPDANIKDVMAEMTRSRVRHLPVVRDGKLSGIISIGDVVKNRLEELETETSVLRDYIVGRG
ncbi:MAG: CBS domain-containing protein [Proteobacteria bacterium]|nr:CBS domain-containing protein [Pseudomonadota bacterium]MCH7796107.1 CBS domain-containing protein [Pseudomonadota bacterium]MCH8002359.1 CBS domain-containing protein [Pseudomonadota bacterium]